MSQEGTYRLILSAGGTGGHIFPALAVADAFKKKYPASVVQFVGALGRMEMERVPAAGYAIEGLPIAGLQRRLTWKNLSLPLKLSKSIGICKGLVKSFKPNAVLGFGGYASGPMLWAATRAQVPTLIQEQNAYPGITNKLLANRVSTICAGQPGLEKVFPSEKLVYTGNPVRQELVKSLVDKATARQKLELDPSKPTLFIMGGSLGARTLNQAMLAGHQQLLDAGYQFLWQTGKGYIEAIETELGQKQLGSSRFQKFIDRMDLAYSAADLVVSRAGALSISELCLLGKATIFVPSPHVAEDHQTKNAQALVEQGAAGLVTDQEAGEKLIPKAIELLKNETAREELAANILKLAKPTATEDIVAELEKLLMPQA